MVTADSIPFTATASLFVTPSVPASRCPAFADTRPTQFRSEFAGWSQQRRCQSTRSWTSEPTREGTRPVRARGARRRQFRRAERRGGTASSLGRAAPGSDAGGLLRLLVDPDEPHPDRVERERDPITDLALVEDVGQVSLDGCVADLEAPRDLGVLKSQRDEPDDLPLT